MAIIGEILIIIVGLIVLIGGTVAAYAAAAFSGKHGWPIIIPILIGLLILWAAGHYGPITITVK